MQEVYKIFWKHWSGVLALIIMASLVVLLLVNLGEIINTIQKRYLAYKEQKRLEELQKPYKNDQYGGETPEETFDLFVAALKEENTCPAMRKLPCGIDLASKYFIIPKQESWKKSFGEIKKANLFSKVLLEMEYAKNNSIKTTNKNEARFSYTLPGEYNTQVIFEKVFEIWKISEI